MKRLWVVFIHHNYCFLAHSQGRLRRLAGRAWALLYQTLYNYTTQANNQNTPIEQSLRLCVYKRMFVEEWKYL